MKYLPKIVHIVVKALGQHKRIKMNKFLEKLKVVDGEKDSLHEKVGKLLSENAVLCQKGKELERDLNTTRAENERLRNKLVAVGVSKSNVREKGLHDTGMLGLD